MRTPDLVNGLFELGGAILQWKSVFVLWKQREIKGVYWPMYFFLSAWGLWNLYFYPSLDQWASFACGLWLVAGNVTWVLIAVSIAINKRGRR